RTYGKHQTSARQHRGCSHDIAPFILCRELPTLGAMRCSRLAKRPKALRRTSNSCFFEWNRLAPTTFRRTEIPTEIEMADLTIEDRKETCRPLARQSIDFVTCDFPPKSLFLT